ncbi:hypothetical protein CUC08_Gglean004708 [Alternaria sp. MG1]|jgi:hypothetical protein|nr:hypothetical protein CUC08_Gglean004708 [Alternaria sp. MG1]
MSAPADEPPALDRFSKRVHLVALSVAPLILPKHLLTTYHSAGDLRAFKVRLAPHNCSPGFCYIPYELLRSISNRNLPTFPGEGKPVPEIWLLGMHCLDVLDLFVQWVYTGEYTELSGSVVPLDIANGVQDLKMDVNRQKPKTMDWAVKAAILAWLLGDDLKVAEFQNYAMARLFAALTRPSEKPQLTPALYDHVFVISDMTSNLDTAMEHLVVRNWGDASVVDQEDLQLWISRITRLDTFRDRFFKESLLSLDQRREKALVAKDYFCGELP